MDRNTNYSRTRHRRRLIRAGAALAAAAMLASTVGWTSVDAFRTAVGAVADRYSLPHWPRYAEADTAPAETSTIAIATEAEVPAPKPLPAATGARVVTIDAPDAVAAPLPLARPTAGVIDHRYSVAPSSQRYAGLAGVAAEYHLPAPVTVDVRAEHDTSVLPAFPNAAVNEDGRTIQLADAGYVTAVPPAPAPARPTPAGPTKSSPSKSAAGSAAGGSHAPAASPSAPTAVLGSSLGSPVTQTPAPTAGDSTGADAVAYETVVDLGLGGPDGHSGRINGIGGANRGTGLYTAPGTDAGGVTYETVVDVGAGGSDGGRNVTDANWSPGDGTVQDVIVNADGSITVVPEPTGLLGLGLVALLARRRRRN